MEELDTSDIEKIHCLHKLLQKGKAFRRRLHKGNRQGPAAIPHKFIIALIGIGLVFDEGPSK